MTLVRPTHAFNSSIVPGDPGIVIGPTDVLRDTNPHVLKNPQNFEPITETVGPFDDQPGEKRDVRKK